MQKISNEYKIFTDNKNIHSKVRQLLQRYTKYKLPKKIYKNFEFELFEKINNKFYMNDICNLTKYELIDEYEGSLHPNKKIITRNKLNRQILSIKNIELNKKDIEKKYGGENSIINSKFKRLDAAHIVEVKDLKNANDDLRANIFDPNNGLYIEPNIHRLWDYGDIFLNENYEFIDFDTNKMLYKEKKVIYKPNKIAKYMLDKDSCTKDNIIK